MRPRLLANRSEAEQKSITAEFKQSTLFREQLALILQKEIDKSISNMRSAISNNVQNLNEYYAQELAKQAAYAYVIEYLKPEE